MLAVRDGAVQEFHSPELGLGRQYNIRSACGTDNNDLME